MVNNDYLELQNQQKNNELISEFKSLYSKLVNNRQSEWERDFILLDAYEKWLKLESFQNEFWLFLVELCEELHSQEKLHVYPKVFVHALKKDKLLSEIFNIIINAENKLEEIRSYLLNVNKKVISPVIIDRFFSEEDSNNRIHSIAKFNKYKKEFHNKNFKNVVEFVTAINKLVENVVVLEQSRFFGEMFKDASKSRVAYKLIHLLPELFNTWINNLNFETVNKQNKKDVFDYFINYSENEFKDIIAAKPSGNSQKGPTEEKKRLNLKKQIRSFGLKSVLLFLEQGEKSDISYTEITQNFAKSVNSREAYLRLSTKYFIQLWSENTNRLDSSVLPKISRQFFPSQHIDDAILFATELSFKSNSLHNFLNDSLIGCGDRIQRYIFDGTSFDPCLESIVKEVFGSKEKVLDEFEKALRLEYEKFNSSLGQDLSVERLIEFANYSFRGSCYEFFRNNCLIHAFILSTQRDKADSSIPKLVLDAFNYEKAFLFRCVFLYRIINVHFKNDSGNHKELICEKYFTYKRDAYSLARVMALVVYKLEYQKDKDKTPTKLNFETYSSKFLSNFFSGILPISNKALIEQRSKLGKDFSAEFQSLCKRVDFTPHRLLDFPIEELLELDCASLLEHSIFRRLWKTGLNKELVSSTLQEDNLDSFWQSLVGKHADDLAYYGYIDDLLDSERLYSTTLQEKRSNEFIAVVKNGNYLGEYIKKLSKNSIRSVRSVLLGFDESLSGRLKNKLKVASNILNLGDERYKLELDESLKPIALGKGGFGCVYKAVDDKLKCQVAIKLIPKWSDALELEQKMLNEAVVMRQCRHVNVVNLFDVYSFSTNKIVIDGNVDENLANTLYRDSRIHGLIMEYIDDARTLKDYVSDPNSGFHEFSFKEKLELFIDICKGVEHAHLQSPQVIHGDIKPENILIDKDGVPKLTDFGVSSSVGSQSFASSGVLHSSTNVMKGNPARVEDDIHSLGILLVYMLFPATYKTIIANYRDKDIKEKFISFLLWVSSDHLLFTVCEYDALYSSNDFYNDVSQELYIFGDCLDEFRSIEDSEKTDDLVKLILNALNVTEEYFEILIQRFWVNEPVNPSSFCDCQNVSRVRMYIGELIYGSGFKTQKFISAHGELLSERNLGDIDFSEPWVRFKNFSNRLDWLEHYHILGCVNYNKGGYLFFSSRKDAFLLPSNFTDNYKLQLHYNFYKPFFESQNIIKRVANFGCSFNELGSLIKILFKRTEPLQGVRASLKDIDSLDLETICKEDGLYDTGAYTGLKTELADIIDSSVYSVVPKQLLYLNKLPRLILNLCRVEFSLKSKSNIKSIIKRCESIQKRDERTPHGWKEFDFEPFFDLLSSELTPEIHAFLLKGKRLSKIEILDLVIEGGKSSNVLEQCTDRLLNFIGSKEFYSLENDLSTINEKFKFDLEFQILKKCYEKRDEKLELAS
ncbi:protein kinase [Pseudoalteromonas sp. S1688]|uniref:protein kinase domain-containing protein n=1 Tax=Pseudoalteromonas sp. S1688 TaxID=579511 RepID=UPI00110B4BAE|nr:protein kinase [Pseudoalteromonas sp. S1688]TMP53580.1 hypothetical protein CWB81_00040 [Pseudoalteromonas sp. S1688]